MEFGGEEEMYGTSYGAMLKKARLEREERERLVNQNLSVQAETAPENLTAEERFEKVGLMAEEALSAMEAMEGDQDA